MGRTPIPLTIWVDEYWEHYPQLEKLRDQGHNIVSLDQSKLPDLILSERAHWWHSKFWTKKFYLDQALKKARNRIQKAKIKEKKDA